MASDNPIKGPFPDGDSRNLTLVASDNPNEPPRSGPQEPAIRGKGAPATVMGDLGQTEHKPEHRDKSAQGPDDTAAEPDKAADTARAKPYQEPAKPKPSAAETAFGGVGGALREPLLQEDWNPAERNSDDKSR